MAIAQNGIQIYWNENYSFLIPASTNKMSDIFSFSETTVQASVEVKANTGGTPASGDTVEFYLLATIGNPDNVSDIEYASTDHGIFLATLDTNTDNPAVKIITIPMPLLGGIIYAKSNASANSITISTIILEQTA